MKKSMMGLLTLFLAVFLVSQAISGSWTSNNFIYKPSVGARGTTEKSSYDAGLDRVDARLGKEIWVGDPVYGSTIQNAIATISGANACLRMAAGTHTISANLTVPANITLRPERGALLAINNGITLTINGPLEAGLGQIFSCTGTGKVIFGAGSVTKIYPEWWVYNATPGTTDMSAAMLAAVAAVPAHGSVILQPTTYKISSTITPTKALHIGAEGSAGMFSDVLYGATLSWAGGASPVISIGKLGMVNFSNFVIHCNNLATYGIDVDRLWSSTWQSINIDGPTIAGVRLRPDSVVMHDNTMFNTFNKLNIKAPIGIILDSVTPASNDVCHCSFNDTAINYTGTYGIYIDGADGNTFKRTYSRRESGTGKGLYLGQNARGNTFVSLISYPGILADTPVDPSYSNNIHDYDQSNSGVAPTISSGAQLVYNTMQYGWSGTRPCWFLPDVTIQGGFKLSGNANRYIYGDTKDVNNNSAFWFQGAGTSNSSVLSIGTGATSIGKLGALYGGTWSDNQISMYHDGTNGKMVTGVGDLVLTPVSGRVTIGQMLHLSAQSAAPGSPSTGDIALANRTNWDPLSKGSGGPYPVWYNGSAWVSLAGQ